MEDEEEEGELMREVPSEMVMAIIPSCHMRLGFNFMFFLFHPFIYLSSLVYK